MSGAPVIFFTGTPAIRVALHFVLVLNSRRLSNRFCVFRGWKRWVWRELPLVPWAITVEDAEPFNPPQGITLEEA